MLLLVVVVVMMVVVVIMLMSLFVGGVAWSDAVAEKRSIRAVQSNRRRTYHKPSSKIYESSVLLASG